MYLLFYFLGFSFISVFFFQLNLVQLHFCFEMCSQNIVINFSKDMRLDTIWTYTITTLDIMLQNNSRIVKKIYNKENERIECTNEKEQQQHY